MKIIVRIILIWAALDVVAAYFWYRFMDAIKPPKLERDIQNFERWQKQ